MTERPSLPAIRAAVEEHGSVRAAARSLGMAESTLRGILKRAEAEAPAEPTHVRGPVQGSKRDRGIVTPKAPQNQPKAPPPAPTSLEYLQAKARAERRRRRRGLRHFRKAFSGIFPLGSPSRPMFNQKASQMIGEARREAGRIAREDQDDAKIARIEAERAAA